MGYLVTKTTPPPVRSCIVPWYRLTDCLWAGLERKLTLVVSVAGSGKTTCLADFARTIAKSQWRTAWLSLDAGDNDLSRFWTYFLAALNEVDPGMQLGVGSSSLGSQEGDCSYLEEPLNRVATAPFDLYFVLDDYHMIQSESIHASVAYWIEHMPANMHLAIASRNTPPLPLSRLRGQDQLVEIHSSDLFFDLNGTTDFLQRVKGLDVPAEDAMALFELTQGWVAGLQLATISMQG